MLVKKRYKESETWFDTKFVFSAGRLYDLLTRIDGHYKVLVINGKRISSYLNR
jgi:hypothetical protein